MSLASLKKWLFLKTKTNSNNHNNTKTLILSYQHQMRPSLYWWKSHRSIVYRLVSCCCDKSTWPTRKEALFWLCLQVLACGYIARCFWDCMRQNNMGGAPKRGRDQVSARFKDIPQMLSCYSVGQALPPTSAITHNATHWQATHSCWKTSKTKPQRLLCSVFSIRTCLWFVWMCASMCTRVPVRRCGDQRAQLNAYPLFTPHYF